jgi:hypothetical protein
MVEGGCTESELLFSGSWSSSSVAREYFEDSQRGAEKRARILAQTEIGNPEKTDPEKFEIHVLLFLSLFFSFLSFFLTPH